MNNRKAISERQKTWGEKNKEIVKVKNKRWYEEHKERVKKYGKKWRQSPTGKISDAKHRDKRRRDLGYMPLNDRFKGCVGHHIDRHRVIFIPEEMHRSNWHAQNRPKTMVKINRLAFEFMEG